MKTYDPNSPFYTDRALIAAERRVQEIKIRQQIHAVDQRLKAIEDFRAFYPLDYQIESST